MDGPATDGPAMDGPVTDGPAGGGAGRGEGARDGVRALVAQTAGAAAAAGWLVALGGRSWARLRPAEPVAWLTGEPADAVMALVRVAALGVAVWLLVSALALGVATMAGWRGLARALARMTLPAARRLAEAALATSVATATVVPAAVAAVPAVPVAAAPPGAVPPALATPEPPGPPASPAPRAGAPGADAAPAETDGHAAAATHRVRRGESLWSIAAGHLAARTGRTGTAAVADYWLRVVAANRDRVVSGDPDLIHPGEVVRLPPVTR